VVYEIAAGSVEKHKIAYENTEDNSGLEGVLYNTHDGSIFILNEKNPGLMMQLSSDFSIIKSYNLSFASDYSGIWFKQNKNELWIVSDQKIKVNHCSISGSLVKSYSVNINKTEGIVLTKDKIY